MSHFVIIHAHFYQPPRENPWLESIDVQPSAHPFHDWNERINEESYAPNAFARILDEQGYIAEIVNNYASLSFNVGPTLLSWMEEEDPDTYAAIIEADKASCRRFGGHGNALAQAHSHLILPLANRRDKETQIKWGIRDFEFRFGRRPEGMWLAEAAVDTETLEILAENGLLFTVLAPSQAAAFRSPGAPGWQQTRDTGIDPRRAYRCHLPSGSSISLFFYDGHISKDVAFNGLLHSGKEFGSRLLHGFNGSREDNNLVHIATDGETYGHHHGFGEMALADCIRFINGSGMARVVNYAYYLSQNPPQWEVKINDNSSWSCAHGIERWRSNCGCHTGGLPGWNQTWRGPLREALDWLREKLIPLFEKEAGELLSDPWEARHEYIQLLLENNRATRNHFFKKYGKGKLEVSQSIRVLKLLELQRMAQLMYTSCGWFFNEVSGIETIQILQYADKALALAKELTSLDLEPGFRLLLERIPSNKYNDGLEVFEKYVVSRRVTDLQIAQFLAFSAFWNPPAGAFRMFKNQVAIDWKETSIKAGSFWKPGILSMASEVTGEIRHFHFALHIDSGLPVGGYYSWNWPENIHLPADDKLKASWFESQGWKAFGTKDLYSEHQLILLKMQLGERSDRYIREQSRLFDFFRLDHFGNRFLGEQFPLDMKQPVQEWMIGQLVLLFQTGALEENHISMLTTIARGWDLQFSTADGLYHAASKYLETQVSSLFHPKDRLNKLDFLNQVFGFLHDLNIRADLRRAQNQYFEFLNTFEGKYAAEEENLLAALALQLGMKTHEWSGELTT